MRWQSVTIASSGFEITMTNALGAYCLMPSATVVMILEFTRDEVVAAHARLAGKPGGDDDDVGALDVLVAVRALELDVEAVDRRGLGDVEHLALGQPLDDVEEDHVAELAQRAELSEHATDLPTADQCNLRSSHFSLLELGSAFGAAFGARYAIASTIAFSVGARAHRRRRLRRVRPVVAADVDRLALRRDQLGVDLRLVLGELLRDRREARLQLLVLRLRRQRLGPVEGEVEVAAAVVDLADLARRRLVVVEELADRLVERLGEDLAPSSFLNVLRDVLQRGRRARRTRRASPSAGSPPSRTAGRASAPSRRRRSRRARRPRGAGRSRASSRWCRSRGSGTGRSGSRGGRCR